MAYTKAEPLKEYGNRDEEKQKVQKKQKAINYYF